MEGTLHKEVQESGKSTTNTGSALNESVTNSINGTIRQHPNMSFQATRRTGVGERKPQNGYHFGPPLWTTLPSITVML